MNFSLKVFIIGFFFGVITNSFAQTDFIDDDDDARYHPYKLNEDEKLAQLKNINPEELESEFWRNNAQNTVNEKLKQTLNTNTAKNVIMFLGDGMSLATVAAARIMVGNEEGYLSFEKFPHFGLSKTYCVNQQVADSACTATAYLTGVKANYGTIGVNAKVNRYDCNTGLDKATHTKSIGYWAQQAGKGAGLVTTTRVTHASPAGVYANTANRDWEDDSSVERSGCNSDVVDDIAEQLVFGEIGKQLKVILGGGRQNFLNNTINDEEGYPGKRNDGKNLIKSWQDSRGSDANASYVWNKSGLLDIDIAETDYILGLFESSHMMYTTDVRDDNVTDNEPSLSEMVEVAIKLLQKEEKGFFLFVEGGRIDTAHHETWARKALVETEEFANAIQKAREMTDLSDTLIVVTSDHSHTMTFAGYPNRGADILGLGDRDVDKLPYTTISYANGPGYKGTFDENGDRVNLTDVDISGSEYEYAATVFLLSETHAGDDVGVYASGPWSHLFVGNYEQNNIPLLMAYAAKLEVYPKSAASDLAVSIQMSIVAGLLVLIKNIL